MSQISSRPGFDDDEQALDDVQPLTAEQAQALRARQPQLSPWRVIGWQLVAGLLISSAAWLVTQRAAVAGSAAYGALAVILPAALFARGLKGRFSSINPGTAVFGFFLWELAKIALSVAMLVAAPRWVVPLSWPALLVGLVVTMKVYWVAMVVAPKKLKQTNE